MESIISMKSIKTVMKLTLATLMHSKIKDFNFIHIISRISIKISASEGIKSVKQSHKNHLSAVNMSTGINRHQKCWLLALLALRLLQLHLPARLQLNRIKT